MNNFSEDESSVYEISILNLADKNLSINEVAVGEIKVRFFPESGTFLKGISNTFGIKIADCSDNGILVQNAEILDGQGNVVSTFSTDHFGYGKFEINSTNSEIYKFAAMINGKKI